MNLATSYTYVIEEFLTEESYERIGQLEKLCKEQDGIELKLELDYKLACAVQSEGKSGQLNEFMCFDGDQLVGYMGICGFGNSPLEVTGMVRPEYRRQGIFKQLYQMVVEEWGKRPVDQMLLLADRKSASGQGYIKQTGAKLEHAEYEMYIHSLADLESKQPELFDEASRVIGLKKAVNADSKEISRQNAIYFGCDEDELTPILPEEEEKRGMTIYLAMKGDELVGKVHLIYNDGLGGIYGLGVLPEYRGLGYGRQTLLSSLFAFKAMGAKAAMLQVAVHNDTALGLYQSCGFVETSTMDYYQLTK